MFEAVREKLQNVQIDISSSYQRCLKCLHDGSNECKTAADRCSSSIKAVEEKCRQRSGELLNLHSALGTWSSLTQQLDQLTQHTVSLQELLAQVERSLNYLTLIADTQSFQERKLDARFELAMYREKKMAELADRKAELAAKFKSDCERRAIEQEKQLSEKQQVCQLAFERDLKTYQSTGSISTSAFIAYDLPDVNKDEQAAPEPEPCRSAAPAAVTLAEDDPTLMPTSELETFLQDVKLEDSGIAGSEFAANEDDDDEDDG